MDSFITTRRRQTHKTKCHLIFVWCFDILSEYKEKYQIIRNQSKWNALYKVSEFVSLALFAPELLVVIKDKFLSVPITNTII